MPEPGPCPKDMRFGPCGGVLPDGACEVGDRSCPFVTEGRRWLPPPPSERRAPVTVDAALLHTVVDVREPPGSHDDPQWYWAETARVVQGVTALVGEHVDGEDAVRLPVADVVEHFRDAGVRCISTLTGRNRTLAEARVEIDVRLRAGAAAVHCVTGDHPAALGLAAPATWGAESFDLLRAVARVGGVATAAEAPASRGPRVERLIDKQAAGAAAVILNHAGDVDALVEFARRSRDAGLTIPMVAPVPLVVSGRSAQQLGRFPGLQLPAGLLEGVAAAADPRAEGIRRAAELASRLRDSGWFAGINVSGPAGVDDPRERLDVTARVLELVAA